MLTTDHMEVSDVVVRNGDVRRAAAMNAVGADVVDIVAVDQNVGGVDVDNAVHQFLKLGVPDGDVIAVADIDAGLIVLGIVVHRAVDAEVRQGDAARTVDAERIGILGPFGRQHEVRQGQAAAVGDVKPGQDRRGPWVRRGDGQPIDLDLVHLHAVILARRQQDGASRLGGLEGGVQPRGVLHRHAGRIGGRRAFNGQRRNHDPRILLQGWCVNGDDHSAVC